MRSSKANTAIAAFALLTMACGARTDLPEGDEPDSSLTDALEQDVISPPDGGHDSSIDAHPDVEDGSIQDAKIDVEDDAPPPPPPPPPQCTDQCTHNYQCEATCPALPSGRWCCDEQVGVCYAYAGHHCPNIVDAGFD